MDIREHGIGVSSNVEDIIKSYTVSADGNINAGDLCEFVNGQIKKTYRTYGNNPSFSSAGGSYVYSCTIDSTHILVAYIASNYLYAVILTINGTSVSAGTPVQITSVSTSTLAVPICLDSQRVFLCYNTTNVKSMVVSISGNVITKNTEIQVYVNSVYDIVCSLLDVDKIAVAYRYNAATVYAVPLTINTVNISVGTSVVVFGASSYPDILTLDKTHAMVSCEYSSPTNIYMTIITLSGTTFTVGAITLLQAVTYSAEKTVLLDETHVLMTCFSSSNTQIAFVLYIHNYQYISILNSSNISCSVITSLTKINENTVVGTNVNTNYPQLIMLTINPDYSVTLTDSIYFNITTAGYTTSVLLDKNTKKLALISSPSTALWCNIVGVTKYNKFTAYKIITKLEEPNVVALASGNSGDTIKCLVKGRGKNLSGLTQGKTYYCDNNGNLTTNTGDVKVGVAISDTELLVTKAYWER